MDEDISKIPYTTKNKIITEWINTKMLSFPGKKKYQKPDEVWAVFIQYMEFMKEETINRRELLRSGESAGTIVDVPLPKIPNIYGFCLFSGISRTGTFDTWVNERPGSEKAYEMFHEVALAILEVFKECMMAGATHGLFSEKISMKIMDMQDSLKLTGSGKNGEIVLEQISGMEIK